MTTFINLTPKYRLRTNKDDFTLEIYKEEYTTQPRDPTKARVKPAGWEGMGKYFPSVLLAVRHCIRHETLLSDEVLSLEQYLEKQALFWEDVRGYASFEEISSPEGEESLEGGPENA
jgi:hypothetical protein